MSYETLVAQIKALPEECLNDASQYINYLLFQYGLNKMNSIMESDDEFNTKMQKGYDDMKAGRVKPLKQAF